MKKILLLIASTALLASCAGGTSSSTSSAADFSGSSSQNTQGGDTSGDASSSQGKQSTALTPAEQQAARDAFLEAFEVTAKHDKIALTGNVFALGEFSGKLATHWDGSSSTADMVWAKIDGQYDLSAVASGLREGELQYALNLEGRHNAEYAVGNQWLTNEYQGAGAWYAANGNAYFDLDEGLNAILESLIGYPYGAGKVYVEDAFNGMPSPLLSDEVVASAKASLGQGIDSALAEVGEFLDFYATGDAYRVEFTLTPEKLLAIGEKFVDATNINLIYVFQVLSKVNFKEAVVSFDYDTTVGFQALDLKLNAELVGTVKEIFPVETGYPDFIADEEVNAYINSKINLAFSYDKTPVLPADLDTYTKVEGGGAKPQDELERIRELLRTNQDPHFAAVDVYNIETEKLVNSLTMADPGWVDYYDNGLFHLTPETLDELLYEQKMEAKWYLDEQGLIAQYDAVYDYSAESTASLRCLVFYPAEYGCHYAQSVYMDISLGDETQSVYMKLEWSLPNYGKTALTAEKMAELVKANSSHFDYNTLDVYSAEGELIESHYDTDDKWAQLDEDWTYHLTPTGLESIEEMVAKDAFDGIWYFYDEIYDTLQIILLVGDFSEEAYSLVSITYCLADGLYADTFEVQNYVQGVLSPSSLLWRYVWSVTNVE